MYQCHICFYLVGHQSRVFEIIKELSPLDHFTHEFVESGRPEQSLTAKADVILADLQDMDALETVRTLTKDKAERAELILFAEKEQITLLADGLSEVTDIWINPMSEEELKFRFLRWQQNYKTDKDFRQASHFLDAVIDSSPNLIWFKDKDGIHEKVNDSFCRTVNKTKKQVEGRGHAYIWNVEQDDPACIESEREVMTKRQTCVAEETIQTGDGTRLLTTYKSPLYDINGSVMGTVGVAVDITKERSYEQEIIKKSHTLETIFATLECGVLCHSLDGRQILSINSTALKILGYNSQEELVAEGFDIVAGSVVEEDKGVLRKSIRELKQEGDSISIEYRVRHKDGELLHVMGNVKLVKENGKLFYQRFLLDCTAQKLEAKKRERHQMELIEALGVDYNLVCYFDLDTGMGTSMRIEDNDYDMFGSAVGEQISLKESMKLYIEKFVYGDDKEMLPQAFALDKLREELAEKKVYFVNYRILQNGEMKYYQMKAVRVGQWKADHGIALGIRSVDEEIRSEMEKNNMLEDALLQANNASKAKSTFLSNMSHDIRTPMNAIVGFTALAITRIDHRDQVEEYLKKIMASGNHLLSLINDVLDMSRIESGKMHLDEKPCGLPDIIYGLRNILQADIHAKQLQLYIDAVDVVDEEIYCDKLRLNQVLLNLLSNSVKYTNAGGTISMHIMEKPGAPAGYANFEFHIKDNGIGMSEEFVSHIFEPFERERSSTISGIQGTGLGMAITKNIVDMMNGTISVVSEKGVGTEFIVSFTFRLNAEAKEVQDIPELKDCRALVVDDDFNTCDNVSYMLQKIGMRAEWTMSGNEAVLRTHQAVMRNDNYNVYIIDGTMPDMDGVEIVRRIKQEIGASVSFIVLTAYDWTDIEEEAKEAGVTTFCGKPLFLSELRNCLRTIVNKGEAGEKKENEKPEKLRSGRILLAEDIELNQEIAVAILDGAGFSTDVAGNGQIAVEMLAKSQPGYYQLVLMDVQMPVMNGYEATKAIRSLENRELATVPIIAMTANAFEEDKQEALKCGMNGHIAKPINVQDLFDTLDKVLT